MGEWPVGDQSTMAATRRRSSIEDSRAGKAAPVAAARRASCALRVAEAEWRLFAPIVVIVIWYNLSGRFATVCNNGMISA